MNSPCALARDVLREELVDEDVDGGEEEGVADAVQDVDQDDQPRVCGKKANTAKRAAWPRMPTIIVVRQPSLFSVDAEDRPS